MEMKDQGSFRRFSNAYWNPITTICKSLGLGDFLARGWSFHKRANICQCLVKWQRQKNSFGFWNQTIKSVRPALAVTNHPVEKVHSQFICMELDQQWAYSVSFTIRANNSKGCILYALSYSSSVSKSDLLRGSRHEVSGARDAFLFLK